jgi:hypothetical protein
MGSFDFNFKRPLTSIVALKEKWKKFISALAARNPKS